MQINIELYNEIKKEYDDFYTSFLIKGELPMGSTEKGFWGYAIDAEVLEAFKKINLWKFKNFIDLGSGDGKVSMIASLFVKKSFGVEFDNELYDKSVSIKNKINIKNVEFHNDDFHDLDLSKYDIIFVNPDEPFERKLEKKLLKEMNGKLIVYGNHFHPKKLKKELEFFIDMTKIGVYSNQKS